MIAKGGKWTRISDPQHSCIDDGDAIGVFNGFSIMATAHAIYHVPDRDAKVTKAMQIIYGNTQ